MVPRIMEILMMFHLLLPVVFGAMRNTATEESEIKAFVGSTVALPCRLDTSVCGNLHSVKFYRETSRIYVYSQVGGVARAEGDATQRMKVEYRQDRMEALLEISPVAIEDEATYKCEITYLEVLENCAVVQLIKLKTLVIPTKVHMLHDDKELVDPVLGPYNEGTEVVVTCEAIGGRPIPDVKWYNGSREIKSKYTTIDNGDGTGNGLAKLELLLSRGDLQASFECRVESDALQKPVHKSFSADVNVRPTSLRLYGANDSVVQGTNVKLRCDVFGGKPAAEIRWFNKSAPITNDKLISTEPQVTSDGTYTTRSVLAFQATRWENGNSFHCYADNSVIRDQKESDLQGVLIIDVEYPPVVVVEPVNITVNESDRTLLLCSYISNPMALLGVVWKKDGQNLTISDDKYEGGTMEDLALVIRNVSRDDMGEYKCICRNKVGISESEASIYLNVQYTPTVEVRRDPASPVRAEDKGNVTLFCEVSAGNPVALSKVKWFMNGELILELPECNYTSYDEDGNGEGYGGPYCGIDSSVLLLLNVTETFAGNYSCQGKNVVGWGPKSTDQELIVYYPPKGTKLRSTPTKIVKKAAVTLHCTVERLGIPEDVTYEWYRGSYLVPDVNTANWTIAPVTLETKSNFTCIAKNAGGSSSPASLSLDVLAPPAFIQNLIPYQGIPVSSENISLTCRVECFPLCKIHWYKDRVKIGADDNKYRIKEIFHPPDTNKNDFESVESTLIWNLQNWPGKQLNKTAPNSNYTCQSTRNEAGFGVNSTMEIAVDYPPDNLTAQPNFLRVHEHEKPQEIICSGKGHPQLTFSWRSANSEVELSNTNKLSLKPVTRNDSGKYICKASNKHGNMTTAAIIVVTYVPECTLEPIDQDGRPSLLCTAHASPDIVTFSFKIKGENETIEPSTVNGLKGYLLLESGIDTFRTYQCIVTNSIGSGIPCERDVAGTASWWKQFANENLIILIAVAVGIIICLIIICIIIILVCRRKRASNKYNNPVEVEEREKPDGQSNASGQTKWPLKPGMLIHQGPKLSGSGVNIATFSSGLNQFKCTSVRDRGFRYKKGKSKIYCRLERLRDLLCLKDQDSLPLGIRRDSNIVTFRKFNASPVNAVKPEPPANPPPTSRKRKKPGSLPNQSSMGDKGGLGGTPQGGGIADPLNDPDKLFYENLPFHGMQNPPNKPISIITPTIHINATKQRPTRFPTSPSFANNQNTLNLNIQNRPIVTRNQSFHGFKNANNSTENDLANASISLAAAIQKYSQQDLSNIKFTSIRTNPNITNSRNFLSQQHLNNSASGRVSGRNEHKLDIRRTASGINTYPKNETKENKETTTEPKETKQTKETKKSKQQKFGSLELRKHHRCYSPTFYSMRCKKHGRKRPVIYALVKRQKTTSKTSISSLKSTKSESDDGFQNLTDSIQILEHSPNDRNTTPLPAPRCKKHGGKMEIIYANVAKNHLNDSSNSESEKKDSEKGVVQNESTTTKAIVHETPRSSRKEIEDAKQETKICKIVDSPVLQMVNANSSIASIKVTPTVKVSPNFIKPKTESPKGALYLQLQAKLKNSPSQNGQNLLNKSIKSETSLDVSFSKENLNSPKAVKSNTCIIKSHSPLIVNPSVSVPKMPLLNTSTLSMKTNPINTKNAFYTLTTPHYKHVSKSPNFQQYSTIPNPQKHHMKLLPRSLFQDHQQQNISKSKSFSSKSKPKKHFQIPLQKCHSFKFQTAESYFQPIKNIHEENLMRNGYGAGDAMTPSYHSERNHKKDKHKSSKGPLVVRRPPNDYQENVQFQENMQNSVQLQYPQPVLGRTNTNGVVYADLDMPKTGNVNKQYNPELSSLGKHQKNTKSSKTEYATLKFNDIGQEIDV
nr:uncharacterized protein LOC111413372 isoform X2 [Onthophagus taurus]